MVEPLDAQKLEILGKKLFSVAGTLAGFASLIVSFAQLSPSRPMMAGPAGLDIVIRLSIAAAVIWGILWRIADKKFGWEFGAGRGDAVPSGWSAVALGATMTVPLAVVPALYQYIFNTRILLPLHWRAMLLVIPAGILANLVMYGSRSRPPNGIRSRFAPTPVYPSFTVGVMLELSYAAVYFSAVVLLYRLIVAHTSIRELVVARTMVPAGIFFFVMTIFITFVPESTRDSTWTQIRGIISALLLMFCFCYGMFL